MYYLGALLLFAIGLAHSYLGEKYLLIRLFRNEAALPKLLGGTDFTKNTLRFAWHITTVAWCGFGIILIYLAQPSVDLVSIGNVVGTTFIAHFAIVLVASKGRHFSWVFFLIIGALVLYGANT